MSKDIGYSDSKADSQGSRLRDLEKQLAEQEKSLPKSKKKLFYIAETKSAWAKQMVKDHGQIVQFADERSGEYRFVCATETDLVMFRKWSYWVKKDDVVLEEI